MGLYEYGCTDPRCSKCVGERFNPGGGWLVGAPKFPMPALKKRKKAKGKKVKAKR